MKKKTLLYAIALLLVAAVSLASVLPMQKGKADRSDWMAALDNAASLRSLTLPGTHDSGALHSIADLSGKCQTLSVKEQLKIGVRFLDIRLQLVNNGLKVVHSFVDQMTDFEDTLADMTDFIRENPSEFLIVSIKEDASPKRSDKNFTDALETMLLSCEEVSQESTLPETVGEARGGIHILARYKNASIGLPCYEGWEDDAAFTLGEIYVQDNYKVSDAEEKIADVRRTYAVASEEAYALVLNYTSCYLDSGFPPIYAGLPAHSINRDTKEAMTEAGINGPLGVLVCDFITSELADVIIGRNFQ